MKHCGQTAAAALVPSGSHAASNISPSVPDYHLHPQYREHTPLEPLLHKREALFDDNFELEKEHDRIAAVLEQWSTALCGTPRRFDAIVKAFAADFRGDALRPVETKNVRRGPAIKVERLQFAPTLTLDAETFRLEFERSMAELSRILTADFQVTHIDKLAAGTWRTDIHFELVATGESFFREQRIGNWTLEWQKAANNTFLVQQWHHTGETRSRSTAPFFEDVTAHALGGNSSYSDQLIHGVDYWRTLVDGASHIDIYGHNGVAVGDVYGKGLDDLYICQPAGLPNRFYRNRGDGTFEDVTATSGLGVLENTACALFADFNNRGHQDLVVVRAEGPMLFVNQGNGSFRPKPEAFQFASAPQGTFTGAAIADYDRDGWLDIYFCLYVYYQGAGQYKYPAPYFDANNGPPNFLMRNQRNGTFRDVTAQAGLNQNNTRYSFCCSWIDANQDGLPDLYVVNDFGRKNLYRNNGDGSFTDIAEQVYVDDVGAGMSVCSFDYDNDGREDLYVANMWTAAGERITSEPDFKANSTTAVRSRYRKHAMGNSLFRNQGKAAFEDATLSAGVGRGRWSWSSDAWDFDHDGFQDLYITNGMISGPLREDLNSFFWRQVVGQSPDEPKPSHGYEQGWTAINELIREDYSWSGYERNIFYLNNGDGSFSDVSGALGLDFIEDGRTFALADLDHDGRLEAVLKNRNGPQVRILKNVAQALPPSISFRLLGTRSNRDAIGTTVTIETELGRQTRTLQAGSGFLAQHSKELFFGLGQAKTSITAIIRWPSGLTQTFKGLAPDHRISVEEGSDSHRAEPFSRPPSQVLTSPQLPDKLPDASETWLLVPISAPEISIPADDAAAKTLSAFRGRPLLLQLHFGPSTPRREEADLAVITLDLAQAEHRDTAAVYNLLYRMLFDRHRDLTLPTSFLIDEAGTIVKIYQGELSMGRVQTDAHNIPKSDADRLAKALPFPGASGTFTFGRNYLSLGSVFFQRGYWNESATAFQLALRDDASSSEACYGLGSVYLKQAKLEQAKVNFEKATALTATYPETKPNAWNNLGLIAMREGQPVTGVSNFQQALRLQPDYVTSLQNLGNAYRSLKQWGDALQSLQQALALAPDDPEVNYSLGMVFAQTGQQERAYALFQHALQIRPVYPEAINNLAILYLRTQRRDQAVKEFERCIQVAPAFDQPYLNLARVYLIEGNRDEARSTLLALLKQVPNHVEAQRALEQLN